MERARFLTRHTLPTNDILAPFPQRGSPSEVAENNLRPKKPLRYSNWHES